MSQGWIKLHRRIQDHWLYPSGRAFTEYEAWQDILLSVNHKKKKVRIKNRVMTCSRGECLRSTKNWAKRWGWGKSKTYRFFSLLEDEGMIETESETITTRLSVCNYGTYQDERNADETEMKRKRNESETTPDTNKNEKNVKNEKKYTIPTREEVEEYFYDSDMKSEDVPLEAEKFINHYEDMDWRKNKGTGKRIDNWHRQAGTWIANYKKWNRSENGQDDKAVKNALEAVNRIDWED